MHPQLACVTRAVLVQYPFTSHAACALHDLMASGPGWSGVPSRCALQGKPGRAAALALAALASDASFHSGWEMVGQARAD